MNSTCSLFVHLLQVQLSHNYVTIFLACCWQALLVTLHFATSPVFSYPRTEIKKKQTVSKMNRINWTLSIYKRKMQMILPYCHRHRHCFAVCYATIVEPFSHRIANVFVDLRTFPLPSIYIKKFKHTPNLETNIVFQFDFITLQWAIYNCDWNKSQINQHF